MSTIALLFALLLPGVQQERTRVSATLSQTGIRVGETVVLSIIVEAASAADIHIKLPAFPPYIVVTGSQEFSQTSFSIPGGRKRVVTREIALQAGAPGTLEIPAIDVEVGGLAHRTRPLKLTVSGSAVRSPGFEGDQAWLRVSMSPDTVYVGQQTTLAAEAGFSEEVRLRTTRPPIFELPSPTGFWVQDIPGGVRSQLRQVEGRVLEVQTTKRAYFPLSAGRFAFSPARIIVDVRQGFLYAPETREIRSASPRLTVLALPDANRPAGFRGAVGRYTMGSSVEPQTVGEGEPIQLAIQVTGAGNIKAIPPPVLPQILGAEVFAPTESAETRIDGEVVSGTKTFTYVVIPERAGSLTIPAIRFAFFDPSSRAYQVLATDPAVVRVLPGGSDQTEVAATSLYPVRARSSPPRLQWVRTRSFLLLQLGPLLLAALVLLLRRKAKPLRPQVRYGERVRAATQLPDSSVYRELGRILQDAITEASATRNADQPAIEQARVVCRHVETARFAPIPPADHERAALLRAAQEVIDMLFGAKRQTNAGALVLLTMTVTLQAGSFASGVAAYNRADYAQAAASFSALVAAQPADASGWYNLGNAYHRMGEHGPAVWAWAAALQLQPRARDVSHNLRAANATEALQVRPPLAVKAEEWLLLAALLWWLAAVFVIVSLARKRAVDPLLIAPFALSLLFALVGTIALREPRFAVTLADQTILYTEPTVRSQHFRQVRAGSVVTVFEERAEWLRVETVDDRQAWVARDDVAEIKTR